MSYTQLNTDCSSTVKQLAGLLAIQNYKFMQNLWLKCWLQSTENMTINFLWQPFSFGLPVVLITIFLGLNASLSAQKAVNYRSESAD